MRRSTVILLVAAFLAASAPAASAAKPAGPTPAARALARADFAAFRHPPGATDRIAGTLLTSVQRRRLRGADTRRIAAGKGWAAYVALEALRPWSGIHAHDDAELLAVGKGLKVEGAPVTAGVRQFATTGTWLTFTPLNGPRTTVALVPDGAVAVRLYRGKDPTATPVDVAGNAIVVLTPDSASISWRRATGPWMRFGVAGTNPATPIIATLLDGSRATLDLGNGVVRTVGLSGMLSGGIPGGYQLARDNTIQLTAGTIAVAPTELLTDDCASPAIASTVPATEVKLDPARPSSAVLGRDGAVTASVNAVLRTILSLRQPNGCGAPSVPSGVADTMLAITLTGRVDRATGLARLHLTSAPTPVTIQACLTPGDPGAGCAQPTAVPATMTTDVTVKVEIG
jgi:hypothetical protein